MPIFRHSALTAFVAGLCSPLASAVIVAGASGGSDNSNNTTRNQLESELGTVFPYFDNVVQYSDSSGVYLGYDPATNDVWVMTALHVVASGSIVIQGETYNQQSESFPGGDVRLVRYHHSTGNTVPNLPSVQLATSTPGVGTFAIMMGYGVGRAEPGSTGPTISDDTLLGNGERGYDWGGSGLLRWGTNNVDLFPDSDPLTTVLAPVAINNTTAFAMDFDRPGANGWQSSNEGISALGDSGGGVFVNNGGSWELAGIFSGATHAQTDASFSNFSGTGGFWGGSVATDVATYLGSIQTAIGVTLVPEPSVAMGSAGLALLGLTRRKRC